MYLIDTHCHLVSDKLSSSFSELVTRAQLAGVEKIINIAYSPSSVSLLLEQLNFSPIIYGTVGIQPHDASCFTVEEAEKMREIVLSTPRIVGIGEIGLDAHYNFSPMDKQIECFEYFLQLAVDVNLPVVIHVRESHAEVISRIRYFVKKGLRGVIHCFTGTLSEAKEFLSTDFYLSFSGIVTFKNSVSLQEVAKYVPMERILIETDSPYLSPMPLRGKLNEPANIIHICRFIANLRDMKFEEVAQRTTTNALTLFNKMV